MAILQKYGVQQPNESLVGRYIEATEPRKPSTTFRGTSHEKGMPFIRYDRVTILFRSRQQLMFISVEVRILPFTVAGGVLKFHRAHSTSR